MPYIDIKTTAEISKEKELLLKTAFGSDICAIPGKSEDWLMVSITDNCRMYFRGSNENPIAMIDVSILGHASPDAYADLTARLTDTVSGILGISPEGIYIKYSEFSTWGYGGENF